MKRCPNCEAEGIDEDLAEEGICSECGEDLDDSDDDEDDDDNEDEDELDKEVKDLLVE